MTCDEHDIEDMAAIVRRVGIVSAAGLLWLAGVAVTNENGAAETEITSLIDIKRAASPLPDALPFK